MPIPRQLPSPSAKLRKTRHFWPVLHSATKPASIGHAQGRREHTRSARRRPPPYSVYQLGCLRQDLSRWAVARATFRTICPHVRQERAIKMYTEICPNVPKTTGRAVPAEWLRVEWNGAEGGFNPHPAAFSSPWIGRQAAVPTAAAASRRSGSRVFFCSLCGGRGKRRPRERAPPALLCAMRRSRVTLLGAMLKVSSVPQTVCAAACQPRSRLEVFAAVEAAGPLFTAIDQARACI